MTITDEQLIAACKQNNIQAQKIVFEKYAGKIMAVCCRYFSKEKSETILEKVFLEFFDGLKKTNEPVFDLMHSIKQVAIEHIKKEIFAFTINLYPGQSKVELSDDYELEVGANRLVEILHELDESKRYIVNFKVLDEMSAEQIAQFFQIGTDDVERIYSIAMQEIIGKAAKKVRKNEFQEEGVAQQI